MILSWQQVVTSRTVCCARQEEEVNDGVPTDGIGEYDMKQ